MNGSEYSRQARGNVGDGHAYQGPLEPGLGVGHAVPGTGKAS